VTSLGTQPINIRFTKKEVRNIKDKTRTTTMMITFTTVFLALLLFAASEPSYSTAVSTDEHHRRDLLVGGYEHADISNDPYIDQAAELVLTTLQTEQPTRYDFATTAVSYRIIQAEQQVVAGMNYKLTILFGDQEHDDKNNGDGGDCVGACKVVVYNHFGDLSITEWSKELTCKEVLAMKDDEAGDEN
jgi:Cystatin domain